MHCQIAMRLGACAAIGFRGYWRGAAWRLLAWRRLAAIGIGHLVPFSGSRRVHTDYIRNCSGSKTKRSQKDIPRAAEPFRPHPRAHTRANITDTPQSPHL